MNKKIDIINGAYSAMRISGLTLSPTPEDTAIALRKLEALASELSIRNVCFGYNFEDSPDVNSASGVSTGLEYAMESVLAFRLLSDFGKGAIPDPVLVLNHQQGMSLLYSATALTRTTQYPTRQPIGSGNSLRTNRYRRFNRPIPEAPLSCSTNVMIVGDVDNFVEHFDSYLRGAETVSSYTIEADSGLTIDSDSLSSPDVNYRITAAGNNGTKSDTFLQVKIVATTSLGRVDTRLINFELQVSPEIA